MVEVCSKSLVQRGTFEAHQGWVTKIAVSPGSDNKLVSASRDKRLIVWDVRYDDNEIVAKPIRSLVGHNHFVSDCALSNDGRHVISSSWDHTLRIWDLEGSFCRTVFKGHTGDVLAVSFSADNRQIFSASRDKSIRLWNIMGTCKFIFSGSESHECCVTSLSLCGDPSVPYMVSAGYDKAVRLWDFSSGVCSAIHYAHENIVNSVHLAEKGSYTASGGKDGFVNVWRNDIHSLHARAKLNKDVNCVKFHPHMPYLAVACDSKIYVFDTDNPVNGELVECVKRTDGGEPESDIKPYVKCTTLTWSRDGTTLYAGFTDNKIRAYVIEATS